MTSKHSLEYYFGPAYLLAHEQSTRQPVVSEPELDKWKDDEWYDIDRYPSAHWTRSGSEEWAGPFADIVSAQNYWISNGIDCVSGEELPLKESVK